MKKNICTKTIVAVLLVLAWGLSSAVFAEEKKVLEYEWYAPDAPKPLPGVKMPGVFTLMGGGAPTSTYSMAMKIYQGLLMKSFPDMVVRVIPGGSMENVKSIQAGKYSFGMTTTPVVNWASKGEIYFTERMTKIRYLATLGEPVACGAFFVLKDSRLQSCKELKDKRICVGTEKAQGRYFAEAELKAIGISFEDINKSGGIVNFIDWSEGAAMMGDGHIDCVYYSGTHPLSSLIELNTRRGIRVLKREPGQLEGAIKLLAGFSDYVIPAGTYEGVPEFHTLACPCCFIASPDLNDDVVYNLLCAMWSDNGKTFAENYKGFATASPAPKIALMGSEGLPWHPGAIKYWKKRGYKTPAN